MPVHGAFANRLGQQDNSADPAMDNLVQQLTKLRDDIFAGVHPRFKIPKHLLNAPLPLNGQGPSANVSAPSNINGVNAQAVAFNSSVPPDPPHVQGQVASTSKNVEASQPHAKAVLQEKRQRLERELEEQVQRKKTQMRLKTCDQEVIPDFDVSEVLSKAHELVKPFVPPNHKPTNPDVSSSDSFDDNTFYSSQMNDSTTTEEAENTRSSRRPLRVCRFFRDGKHCPYGEKCTFSHDPAILRKIEAEEQKANSINHRGANDKAIRKPAASPPPPSKPSALTRNAGPPKAAPDSDTQKIAELEEQLRQLRESQVKDGQRTKPQVVPRAVERDDNELQGSHETDEYGRDRSRRGPNVQSARNNNNVHVVRNNIPSPLAPQPARVSPLAVSKAPHFSHVQRQVDGPPQRDGNTELSSARQSPVSVAKPLNPRKRRRRNELGEGSRNVMPRTEALSSPAVFIKEEPVSPPPFNRMPDNHRIQRLPTHADTSTPVFDERIPRHDHVTRRPRQVFELPEERPITPSSRQVTSRNSHMTFANEDADLRRVVSGKYMRAPPIPGSLDGQYSDPAPRFLRAASQLQYESASERAPPIQYRASVQPQARDRFSSPQPRQIQIPQPRRTSLTMAPPTRRIVVDQFGNRFVEAPMSGEQAMSMTPKARQVEIEPQYERVQTRPGGSRSSQQILVDEDGRYLRHVEADSLPRYTEAQYMDYPRGEEGRRVVNLDHNAYTDDQYDNAAQYVSYQPQYVAQDAEMDAVGQAPSRRQTVRPGENQFESSTRQPSGRTSSMRPQQPRIVNLGEHHEATPSLVRERSMRPEPMSRPVQRVHQEPLYQYLPEEEEGRYPVGLQQDEMYEPTQNGSRKYVQRL